MADYSQAPLVPRSSKQAKMLGVGADIDQRPPGSAGSNLSDWNGWGVQDQAARGRQGSPADVAPPWGNGAEPKRKGTLLPSSSSQPLRGTRSASVLRGHAEKEPPVKEKKRGLFGGLLKRRGSKSDVRDQHSDSGSVSDFGLPPPAQFDSSTLPAKLQARGDAYDLSASLPSRNGKSSKKSRRPTTPIGAFVTGSSRNTPTPRQQAVYPNDPGIALDTNLDSMEGIISFAPSTSAGVRPTSSHERGFGGSVSSGTSGNGLTRSGSGSHASYASNGRRPSLAPSYSDAGSRGAHHGQASAVAFWNYGGGATAAEQKSAAKAATLMGTAPPAVPGVPGGAPVRPGLGSRTSSQLSITGGTATPTQAGMSSSGSTVKGAPPVPRGSAAARTAAVVGGAAGSAGAWTAPDSWAVKTEAGASLDHDSSEDDVDEDEMEVMDETEESEPGASPRIGTAQTVREGMPDGLGAVKPFGSMETEVLKNGRPATGGSRTVMRSGRPGTADGEARKASQKPFMVRIYRVDNTFSTLPVPLGATASEMTAMLARKFQVNAKTTYALYLREKGLERRVGPNEKPVWLQRRKFEQAGYTELDKLEELGREDNSYLSKLVYKARYSTMQGVAEESFAGESMEFVDLSGKGVETIPIFLYKHSHEIRSLNLSRNRPFDLPTDFIQGCTALRELVLSNMGIKRLPQAIKECQHLTRLDISNNNIVDLDHIALHTLGNLSSIKCHNNRLSTVPEYFRNFRQLKYLNLSNNRFDKIPLVVCEIEPLLELDFSFNTVTVVPPEIGQLENLERLNLLANILTSLPSTLGSLISLKELDIRRNVISDFSPLTSIPVLEVLRCEHNQASTLDASWANIRVLTAKHNSLTRFALTGTSTTLTSLNLSYGKLSTLSPEIFGHLGSVETLVLDNNTLRILPDGIGSLPNLVTFSIKNNLLTSLPDSIGRLQRLQSLQVSGNDLQTLPSALWLCSQLSTLNASSNLIKDFPDPPLPTVAPAATPTSSLGDGGDELDLRQLAAAVKPPTTSSGRLAPPLSMSLQRLFLGDNQLGDDVFAPISLMAELRVLNLSFNDIYEIPTSSLFKCQSLEELYLSGNKLTSLPPDDLERLVNLKLLYLNGNKLQTLPAELGKIKKLFALDVGSNVLKYNIANWPYDWNWNWNLELRYLNLSGNKRLEIKPGHQNDTSNLPRSAKRRNLADFSALTKLHVLGLMDVTLMIPSVPDENDDRRVRTSLSEINDMGYGIADTLGSRFDTLSLVDIVIPRFRSKDDEAIFGLFDAVNKGQNTGARLVKYLQDAFSAVLTLELSRLKSGEVTSDALRRAFLNINRDYGNLLLPALESRRKGSEISLTDKTMSSVRTGAAGIIVYIRRKRLYVANAGNALAVIAGRGGTARLIAKRHEPFDSGEIARIRTAEGWISHRGYVNDEVDIARSFGFYNVFPAINAAPDVDEIELTETDEFVIIANRGLWEHMSYQTAVDVARTERSDPMAAAAKLRDLAISYGSSSNVMVMVLAVGDLFKAKKSGYYAKHRAAHGEDEGFYGAHKAGVVAGRRGKGEEGAGERYLNLLDREVPPPVGMVALVFTDIRNSTALWESNPGMQTAIRMHNQLLRRQLRAIGGYEVKTEGDAFMVSFPTVTSALLWCLTVQLELLREDWPQEILDSEEGKEILDSRGEILYRGLSVRMGIHWGAPVCEADPITRRMDYFGPIVNRAARISAVAEGGQISASQDVIDIIQDVVMQQKPGLSSLDSDDGEDVEDPEEYLDPRDKQDIAALRRLGFGITELGERKLKGLESAELISLIWPRVLKERIVPASADRDGSAAAAEIAKKTEVVQDETPQLLDVNTIKALGKVVQRLESVCGVLVHGVENGVATPPHLSNSSARPSTPAQRAAAAKRKTLVHLTSFAFPVRADATDDELCALLESYLVRIENCLSTLTLHQLGPFTEVLSALGQALRIDQRSVLLALTRFAGLQQQQAMLLQAQASKPPSPAPDRPLGTTSRSTVSRAGQPHVRQA
ncbi:cysteinyl-tRNA synthetase [Rhodotorula toruloides]